MLQRNVLKNIANNVVNKSMEFNDIIVKFTTVDGKKYYGKFSSTYNVDYDGCGYVSSGERKFSQKLWYSRGSVRVFTSLTAAKKKVDEGEVFNVLMTNAIVTYKTVAVRRGLFEETCARKGNGFLGIGGYYVEAERHIVENWKKA